MKNPYAMRIKKALSKILPDKLIYYYRVLNVIKVYMYDVLRITKVLYNKENYNEEKLTSEITILYHVIEKGLTMSETRLGFGKAVINNLIAKISDYEIKRYPANNIAYIQAVSVIKEYIVFHKENEYHFEKEFDEGLNIFLERHKSIKGENQRELTIKQYFENSVSSFDNFCRSRYSVRNYSDKPISLSVIEECIELAQKSPSFCNRQPSRVYVIKDSNKKTKILELQNGNRGFGHLADTIFIITSSISKIESLLERHENYLNTGMFIMSLLYALHFKNIAACSLNWSVPKEKDVQLRKLLNIPENELIIIIISAGYPPERFKIASSPRLAANEITKYH